MVINADPKWNPEWMTQIQHLEQVLTAKYEHPTNYDICGMPTKKGTPCQYPPYIRRAVTTGRCKIHSNLPELPSTKKGIFEKKLSFMRCNVCDIGQSRCPHFEDGSDCNIEADIYNKLNEQLDDIFPPPRTLRNEILCDNLVTDVLRIYRCQMYENYLSTSAFVADKVAEFEDRLHKRVLTYLNELELKQKVEAEKKGLFARVGVKVD